KPDALQHSLDIKYKGFEIPTDFVVGYGLDYDGLGRNFPDIYSLVKETNNDK
ncbi:MAG: hypoxanthine phosphoribosyltransferase, partial [Saprospiraceae bacterium]